VPKLFDPSLSGGEACTARYYCRYCSAEHPNTPKHSGHLCTHPNNPRYATEKPNLANVKIEATPSATPEPRPSSSGKTWQKNPRYTYVAKTEQQAASLAASVASLQSAIRDIKQHHETITAENTANSADSVLEN
jgi:hypothetical protein